MIEDFALTEGEKAHPLWVRLKAYFEEQLRVKRCKNDEVALPAEQTAALRGEIRLLKGIIALGNDRPLTGN